MDQFEHILKQICTTPSRTVGQLSRVSPQHLDVIWEWNSEVPETVNNTISNLIAQRVLQSPDRTAVEAWDGSVTYKALDDLSTRLAYWLREQGICTGTFVPLCFEKSLWTPVAMLGVMKAGGASVLLDVEQPPERLSSVVGQLAAKVVLCSDTTIALAESLSSAPASAVSSQFFAKLAQQPHSQNPSPLPVVDPSWPLCVVFTSGSTGSPKGALLTHKGFCSAVEHQKPLLGIDENTRLFDFSSYAFDVAWGDAIHTLAAGGCLCIPSAEDRNQDVAGSIQRLKANYLVMTPTLCRILDPQSVPAVRDLVFLGEPMTNGDADRWPGVSVRNIYGPAECTVFSTIADIAANQIQPPSIGRGSGLNGWIVDEDGEELAAVGSIGELWLEGPLVAAGYLNNLEKTSAAFIQDPAWLVRGCAGHPGRGGTLYRTGDLVRYHSDGSMLYQGRKDAQVKIRGQRTEMGDIEYHLGRALGHPDARFAVDVVTMPNTNTVVLVAFIAMQEQIPDGLEQELGHVLPSWMVPTFYVKLDTLPMTATGKTDRRALRNMGQKLNLAVPASTTPSAQELAAWSPEEARLRQLWSLVLHVDESIISQKSNFLHLGGSSITAMQLVTEARQRKVQLAVRDVLTKPVLQDLALLMGQAEDEPDYAVPPFLLLKKNTDIAAAKEAAAKTCNVGVADIQDMYPCTALQEGMLARTLREPSDYVARFTLELHDNVNIDSFKNAWSAVAESVAPILRTRIVNLGEQGLVQVVLKRPIAWIDDESIYGSHVMGLGTPLTIMGVTRKDGRHIFTWVMHHATYDGWSLPLVVDCVTQAYQAGRVERQLTSLPALIKHSTKVKDAEEYWQEALQGFDGNHFPSTNDQTRQPRSDTVAGGQIDTIQWPQDVTPDTAIRAAWALVMSSRCESADVVYGVVVSGRQAAVPGIETLAGPTIATVPLRVAVDDAMTVDQLYSKLQTQAAGMVLFEQLGLPAIRRLSDEAAHACDFRSMLVVQPPYEATLPESPLFKHTSVLQTDLLKLNQSQKSEAGAVAGAVYSHKAEGDIFTADPLTLHCQQNGNSLVVNLVYDSHLISEATAQRIIWQFEYALKLLSNPANGARPVHQLSLTSPQDLEQIWSWNPPMAKEAHPCVHKTISKAAAQYADEPAVHGWDGLLTYRRLDELSTLLALQLVQRGITRGSVVPLLFEKSIWMPVAALAVMKAGAASVSIDPSQAKDRLEYIMGFVRSEVILCGHSSESLAHELSARDIWVVNESMILESVSRTGDDHGAVVGGLPQVLPDDLLYVVFTSGSTGNPKGVMISHANFGAAIAHQQAALGIVPRASVADFVSYAFDVSWSNLLQTLANGACLCIPSEKERKSSFVDFMAAYKVTYAHLTPSVAAVLDLHEVPSLHTVSLIGELVDFDKLPHLKTIPNVIVTYGPAECTPVATATTAEDVQGFTKATIGFATGTRTWIVDSAKNCLAPIGAVGEIVVEGPLVGQGYLNNPQKTADAFISDPSWLLAGSSANGNDGRGGRVYRTGDLARYTDEGELVFIGRRDTQVKIRGQRTELSDIEHHVYQLLKPKIDVTDVIADLTTVAATQRETLVAFLCINGATEHKDDLKGRLRPILQDMQDAAKSVLPSYMIPSLYAPVAELPRTPSGKTDRKALRKMACSGDVGPSGWIGVNEEQAHQEPVGDAEVELRSFWSAVLNLPERDISRSDNFFHIGGDSIVAMRLSATMAKSDRRLLVPDMFKHPLLSEMSKAVAAIRPSDDAAAAESASVEPFSQLRMGSFEPESLLSQVAAACSVDGRSIDAAQVEDVFPCTPLQQGLMAITLRNPGYYVRRLYATLEPTINIATFQMAWERVAAVASVLRTRIVEVPGQGMVQAVLREPLRWQHAAGIDSWRDKDIGLGTPLSYFRTTKADHHVRFTWVQHHAVYDGWSIPLIQRQVDTLYANVMAPVTCRPMQHLTTYIAGQDQDAATAFWRDQFDHVEASRFPSLPSNAYVPQVDKSAHSSFAPEGWSGKKHTDSTILRAAWAILIHWYTRDEDVVFGSIVSGRQAAIKGVEHIAGPTIATVPLRIRVQGTVGQLLDKTQMQAAEMVPHEQFGLQNIRQVSAHAKLACGFQSVILVQPSSASSSEQRSVVFVGGLEDDHERMREFNTYAVMLECFTDKSGITAKMSFDSNVLRESSAANMLRQLQMITEQLVTAESTSTVGSLHQVSNAGLQDLLRWNKPVQPVPALVHDLIRQRAIQQPETIAIDAWDGQLTYSELDQLSTKVAQVLTTPNHGTQAGDIIPIYFEKSKWVSVVALGVMKAGAASVLLDVSLPKGRLQSIVSQLSGKVLLTSAAYQSRALELTDRQTLVIQEDSIRSIQEDINHTLPQVASTAPLYIVFTSGSTGTPKGATITHDNFASAAFYQQDHLGLQSSSRVYDYISYAFDVAWSNLLHTLIAGACLCIPSEDDRTTDISGSIQRLNANFLHITPSIGRLLDPTTLGRIESVLFIGEALKSTDVERWASCGIAVYNTYGPAECTVTSTICQITAANAANPPIGTGVGVSTWIVDPAGPSKLAAVGTVGELWLQGPIVGAGYLNNVSKTDEVFTTEPDWLPSGDLGDLVHQGGRFYRTGDLAYYDADGCLFFVGRKDTQTKINGQRMELGEVEFHAERNIVTDVPVEVAAEIIVPEVTQSQTLALFVQVQEYANDADAKKAFQSCAAELRRQLHLHLPAFMVPTAYIPMAAFPMTASGKTDRKALRLLGTAYVPHALDEPEGVQDNSSLTQTERDLAEIWASLLKVDTSRIGRDMAFEQLGGDSIKTVSLLMAIRKRWDVSISLPTLLSHQSGLSHLAALIDRLRLGDSDTLAPTVDLESELISLAARLSPSPLNPEPLSVLLTGATGFLGIQILRSLLAGGQFGRVILLVRPSSGQTGMDRVVQAARAAGWWQEAFAELIEVWDGDLSKTRLGLEEHQWNALCGTGRSPVHAIVHNGAQVHWTSKYLTLKPVNVDSTVQLVQAAMASSAAKTFVYISGGLITSNREWTLEESKAATGYDQTKYLSERLVYEASLQSLRQGGSGSTKFSVVKPGQIIGDVYYGMANPDDFLWRVVMCAAELGVWPAEADDSWLSVSDVRYVSDLVVLHASGGSQEPFERVRRGMPVNHFWKTVAGHLGRPLQPVSWAEWIDRAQYDIDRHKENHVLWPVQHFFGQLGITEAEMEPDMWDMQDMAAAVRKNLDSLCRGGYISRETSSISSPDSDQTLSTPHLELSLPSSPAKQNAPISRKLTQLM